jgi:hypothetical protein
MAPGCCLNHLTSRRRWEKSQLSLVSDSVTNKSNSVKKHTDFFCCFSTKHKTHKRQSPNYEKSLPTNMGCSNRFLFYLRCCQCILQIRSNSRSLSKNQGKRIIKTRQEFSQSSCSQRDERKETRRFEFCVVADPGEPIHIVI